jgi:hypothetical protein
MQHIFSPGGSITTIGNHQPPLTISFSSLIFTALGNIDNLLASGKIRLPDKIRVILF